MRALEVQNKMKPKSDNLFHFTKSLDVLKLILEKGISPRYCLEDFEWFGSGKYKHLAFPISCFCDIPLSRISEHTDFYGAFGIGLSKDWGLRNSLEPVAYCANGGKFQKLTKFLMVSDFSDFGPNVELYEHTYKLLTLMKPLSGKMVVAGKPLNKDFYQESEWRFVAPGNTLIEDVNFESERDNDNSKVEKYTIPIAAADIKYIFVQSDSDIPTLVDFINTRLGHFSYNDVKILLSRITSLETISNDL
jgi:hypothetical protein